MLSGLARHVGPYRPVVAYDDDGRRITDTRVARMPEGGIARSAAHRHADTDLTPVDTRQRRRQQARIDAKAARPERPTPERHNGVRGLRDIVIPGASQPMPAGYLDPGRAKRPSTRRHGRTRYGLDRAAAGGHR